MGEVRAAIKELTGSSSSESDFTAIWEAMDADGDGLVTRPEFESWWEKVRERSSIFTANFHPFLVCFHCLSVPKTVMGRSQ